MSVTLYPNNFDEVGDWLTDTYLMLLHDRGDFAFASPDLTVVTVADLIALYGETASVGYTRAPMTTPNRIVDDAVAPGSISLGCDPFDFGIPVTGQWDAATLYREVTNDADSLVIGTFTFGYLQADGGNVLLFPGGDSGGLLLYTSQTITTEP